MKFNQTLTNFVMKDLSVGSVPMLLGEPGIGKSSWLESLAEAMKTKCFVCSVNELADKADLTGARLVPTGKDDNYKQVFFPHADIMDAIEYANEHPRETPILFLDEINRTPADITSAALSIPTKRRIGSIKLPPNLKVVIAGNDKGHITSLDDASVSRFTLYHTEPDAQTFLDLFDDLNPFVRNVLTKNPQLIFCKSIDIAKANADADSDDDDSKSEELSIDDIIMDGEGMQQFTTPRTITSLSNWLNTFDKNELIQFMATPARVEGIDTNVLMEGIVGHAGYTNFAIMVENEIRTNINTLSTTSAAKTPKAPNCYAALKQQPNVTELQNYIMSLNSSEMSACILYALYEKIDNRLILTELVKQAKLIEPMDMQLLMSMIASEDYDKENWNVVVSSGTQIGNMLEMYSNV